MRWFERSGIKSRGTHWLFRYAFAWSVASGIACTTVGCLEIQAILSGEWLNPDGDSGGDGGNGNGDGNGGGSNGGGPGILPRVSLTVSNPVPQLNETVLFRCTLLSGNDTDLSFTFQPSFGRLIVNETDGTATFVVDESDIGSSQSFTCTATNRVGEGPPSNSIVVVASAGPEIP